MPHRSEGAVADGGLARSQTGSGHDRPRGLGRITQCFAGGALDVAGPMEGDIADPAGIAGIAVMPLESEGAVADGGHAVRAPLGFLPG